MRLWLVAPLLLTLSERAAAVEDGDLSCPATGGSAACGSAGDDPSAGRRASRVPDSIPSDTGHRADLVKQEVEELRELVKISKERIGVLTELQDALQSQHLPLLETQARVLRERFPLLSDVASDVERTPGATADDFLLTKAVIPSTEEVKFVKFMPLRNHKSGSAASTASSSVTTTPSALLAAVQADGAVQLFSPSGELVHSFSAGHEHPVTGMAVSPSMEENVLATSDTSGVIRLHKVGVRQGRAPKSDKGKSKEDGEEKVSQYLAPSLNVSSQLQRQMQMPHGENGEALRVTTLALAQQGNSRYVFAGDDEGKVNVFLRNGTLKTRLDTAANGDAAVDSLSSSLGTVVFRSGSAWGYIDLERLEVKPVDCPRFDGRVQEVALDPQQSTRALAVDENGTVWVFHVHNKKECRIDMRFATGSTRGPMEVFPIKGYAIGLESGGPGEAVSLVALNMSQPKSPAGKGNPGGRPPDVLPPPATSAVVWRRPSTATRAWSLLRRNKEGDLVALVSENGREIEIIEVLMAVPTPPVQTDFGNFQMPVIGVTIVLVLGYQYMKQRGAQSSGSKFSGGGGGGGGKISNDDFIKALQEKRKAKGKDMK